MSEIELIDKPETGLIAKVGDLEIDQETRISLCKSFDPLYSKASEWAEQASAITVKSAEDKDAIKAARELRLNLKSVRVEADKLHKKMKADSLRRGRAIDGMRNIVKALIEPMEEHLQEQEDFVKREREIQIERRQADRAAALDVYGFDHAFIKLGEMEEDSFKGLLQTAITAHNAKKREAEEAAAAEAKRIEEEAERERQRVAKQAAERKRIKAESARLKKEQAAKDAAMKAEREQREKELAAERAKAEKERKALEAKQAAERKKAEAAEKKRKAEAAKKLKAEQEAKAAAEAEAKRLREAEQKRQREEQKRIEAEEAERQKALQADDSSKLDALVLHIQRIELKSEEGQEFLKTITGMISDFVDTI